MSATYSAQVGNKGRIVIPAPLRQHKGWADGTNLVVVEVEAGALLASRSHIEEILRAQLAGHDVVGDLLEERRLAASTEDAV